MHVTEDVAAAADDDRPTAHPTQLDEPVAPWYLPEGQFVQLVAAAGANMPDAQSSQTVDADAVVTAAYLPAAHAVHAPLFGAAVYAPAPQCTHAVAPGAEYVPSGQAEQPEMAFTPVSAVKKPAGQPVHAAEPAVSWYLPTEHWTQLEEPCAEYVPLEQLVHAVDPVAGSYFPASHSTQKEAPALDHLLAAQSAHELDPEAGCDLPAGQVVHKGAAAAEKLPLVHSRQTLMKRPPVTEEYLPEVQPTHVDWPVLVWNVPAGQSAHASTPPRLNLPAAQCTHLVESVDPTAVEYLATPHRAQVAMPVSGPYRPELQPVQLAAPLPE